MGKPELTQLLPGEHVVTSNEILTLTNYRVFRDASASGSSRYVSISLDAISSCGLVTTSQPLLLVLGIIATLGAFVVRGEAQGAALIVGIVLIVLYFATRAAVMAICSTGGERITVPTKPSQYGVQRQLLNAIDHAKLAALGRMAPLVAPPAMIPSPMPYAA